MKISKFVEAALSELRESDLLWTPDPLLPARMRDLTRSSDNDWQPWKPIASEVTEQDILDLQTHFKCSLPPAYARFLKHSHFYELCVTGVDFAPNVVGRWKQELIALYDSYRQLLPKNSNLVPIGRESLMDAGPACLDIATQQADGDCQVVFWDHDACESSSQTQLIFSSTTKMFECLHFAVIQSIGFVCHDPEFDSAEDLPKKQLLLDQFLRIDPDGAGGPGQDYWTSWGVTTVSAR
jgi:hypothetical protein